MTCRDKGVGHRIAHALGIANPTVCLRDIYKGGIGMSGAKTHGTNVHVIDGKTFVEVERPAKVGDKILITDAQHTGGSYMNGSILSVTRLNSGTGVFCDEIANDCNYGGQVDADEYVVLAEVVEESAPSNADIIANLIRRVHSLEQQLRDTQNNVERQGVEIANIEAVTKAPQSGAKLLADAFEALAKYERSVGR
jgi:hypothetical protein